MTVNKDTCGIFGRLTKLEEYKRISKDRLYFLLQITFILMNITPIRLIIIYVFCQYFFATTLTICHLLIKFDTVTLLKHGSFCGIQIFVLINLGAIVFMANTFFEFLKSYREMMLPVELLNEGTLKRVILMGRLMILICIVDICCAAIAGLGFIAAPEYFNERTYLSVWIQETFPEYSSLMLLIVHWTSMVVALVMAGSAVAFAYAGCNGIFQVYIMIEMVEDLRKTNIPSKMRRESKVFQAMMKQKLSICILAWEMAMRFQNIANDILEAPLLLFSLGSIILGGSLMIEFLSNQEQDFGSQYAIYVGIFFFILATGISGALYLLIGQAFKDESEKINYHLRQLPWYDLDAKNQVIYAIFLHRTEKPLTVSCSLAQIDYSLLVRILKSLYSLAAVLAQFVTSQSAKVE